MNYAVPHYVDLWSMLFHISWHKVTGSEDGEDLYISVLRCNAVYSGRVPHYRTVSQSTTPQHEHHILVLPHLSLIKKKY